jgi:hypothetical protein
MLSARMWVLRITVLCSVVLLLAAISPAQVYYGTIRGTVMDSSGAVAPGVEVVILNTGTGISQKVVSNEVGNYVAPNLIPGTYRISAERAGFKRFEADNVELISTADRRVDVSLEVGAAADSVTVEAGAQLIETEKGSLSDTKSNEVFSYVPVNANYRSIWNLVRLTPGVPSYGNSYGGAGDGGNNGYDTNFTIDGIPAKDGWSGWTMGPMLTSIDSYREMRINISGTGASSGTSSEVAVVSESGTNGLHGEAWLHYNAIGFMARDFFDPVSPNGPPTYRPNFKVGGPVVLPKLYNGKDRTFFHFTWQGLRGSQSPQTVNAIVPDTNYRNGLFPSVILDPLTGSPFPGNQIPASRISSVSKYYQDTFYPGANTGANEFRAVKAFPQGNNYYAARFDHKISEKNSVFFRFLISRSIPSDWWDGNPNIGEGSQWRNNDSWVASDTHVFSPTIVNELRVGHSVDESYYHGPNMGRDVVAASGLQLGGNLPDVPAMPAMNITGFDTLGQTSAAGWKWNTYHFQDALHIVRGKHNLSVGTQISQYNGTMYPSSPSDVYGTFGFDGRFSGDPYADFLLGIPSGSSRRTSVSPTYPHRLLKEFYVTDDWKITPRLTLNLGLRYSLLDPGTIDKNVIANFNVAAKALVIPASAQSLVAPEYLVDTPLVTNDKVGLSNKLLNIDRNNFAPRVGFAWRPGSTKDFVIRGGGGIYYVGMQPYVSDGGGAPYEISESYTNSVTNGVPLFAFPNPFPASVTHSGSGGFSASGMDPNLATPYSIQANLTVEKEILGMGISASFLTTMARKTVIWHNLDAVQADTTPFDVKYANVPYPFFWAVNYANNGGSHNYRAGYIKAERNFTRGLYYQAHLTWSKSIGDDVAGNEDPFNRARDRAASDIPAFRAVVSLLYDLPFGKGKTFGATMPAFLNYVVGGWRLSTNYQWENGTYFTPSFSGTDPANTNAFGGRPDCIANGNLPKSERTMERYFNTDAFVAPPDNAGRYGTCGANILQGPGLNVLNAGLMKELDLGERFKMRLEGVSSNVLNHPSFGAPGNTIGTSSYGVINYTRIAARNLSITARLEF